MWLEKVSQNLTNKPSPDHLIFQNQPIKTLILLTKFLQITTAEGHLLVNYGTVGWSPKWFRSLGVWFTNPTSNNWRDWRKSKLQWNQGDRVGETEFIKWNQASQWSRISQKRSFEEPIMTLVEEKRSLLVPNPTQKLSSGRV